MRKGRSKYLHFENARKLVRSENIRSIAIYLRWHKHNNPKRIPKRPDIIYAKKGWVSWNDFLGNENKFAHQRKNYCPYEEGRKYARALGLTSKTQWLEYCNEGKCPPQIPHRPEYYYKGWFTWKDWLGKDLKQLAKEATQNIPILFVIKMVNTPNNVYKINVTHGGPPALIEATQKGARVIAAFEYRINFDWRSSLARFANNFWGGESDDYAFSNINGFLFEISSVLPRMS